MAQLFPQCQHRRLESPAQASLRWEVVITPLPPREEWDLVVADLDRGKTVEIASGGQIYHHLQCRDEHRLRKPLEVLIVPDLAVRVELIYQEPPAHPRVRVLEPKITPERFPGHPHFYADGCICPIFPPDGTWRWERDTAAEYLVHVAIWLVKHAVWKATQERNGRGVWIGPDVVQHSIASLMRHTDPSAQCPCGSGRPYRQCCRPRHERELGQKRIPRFSARYGKAP